MRIVGGKWRGLSVEAPEGRGTTRPTTDRNRERFASMILSAAGLDLSDVEVLDAFAGSGAMGFELVSRGAARAVFVDLDRRAVARIRRNARALGAGASARVLQGDVFRLAERGHVAGAPFSLVVLDPPYDVGSREVGRLVEALRAGGMLAGGTVVLYEHASREPGIRPAGASVIKEKSHGITTVQLLRMGDGHE